MDGIQSGSSTIRAGRLRRGRKPVDPSIRDLQVPGNYSATWGVFHSQAPVIERRQKDCCLCHCARGTRAAAGNGRMSDSDLERASVADLGHTISAAKGMELRGRQQVPLTGRHFQLNAAAFIADYQTLQDANVSTANAVFEPGIGRDELSAEGS